jgi:lipopolysaccharide export system permease protein
VHIRERQPNGTLLGILVDDRRNPKERSTYLAEQGEIVRSERGTFLFLENGSVQRREADKGDPTLVLYDRYAFDLSHVGGGPTQIRYTVRERYHWELLKPDAADIAEPFQLQRIRAEIHDRIAALFYPLVFVVITFAFLGTARTTRQSRALSLTGAIASVAALRIIGFASGLISTHVPMAVYAQYVALFIAFVLGLHVIVRGIVIEPPALLTNAINAVSERFARRAPAT